MGRQFNRVFRIKDGHAWDWPIQGEDNGEPAGDGRCRVKGDEFEDSPDGWYWQHREMTSFSPLGTRSGRCGDPFVAGQTCR
jgi:hypothetical protein